MIRALSILAARHFERELKNVVSPLAPYLRKLAIGAGVLFVAVSSVLISLIAGVSALFLRAANLPHADAAGWTAGFALLISLALAAVGLGMLRRPRRYI